MKRIGMIAGEASGDILGSRLIRSLKQHYPDAVFEGIGGEQMQEAGCNSLYSMDTLSVMGLAEVLSRLRTLLKMRKALINHWIDNPPDVFIGIDAPDFNLKIEARLHHAGIPSVHYVSPSVWAWREKRVTKIQNNLDLMLTLFPFEVDFYQKHQIPSRFVGHPLADEIPEHSNKVIARKELGLKSDSPLLAVLPGSRSGEIQRLAPVFLESVSLFIQQNPSYQVVIPIVNSKRRAELIELKQKFSPETKILLVDGNSTKVMQAADYILMASGTAVLEGMLVNRPMIAAYKLNGLTAWILRTFKMMNVEYFTLPNNLAGECLVPELMQENVTAEKIFAALQDLVNESKEASAYREKRFNEIHRQLKQNASEAAATEIVNLLAERC